MRCPDTQVHDRGGAQGARKGQQQEQYIDGGCMCRTSRDDGGDFSTAPKSRSGAGSKWILANVAVCSTFFRTISERFEPFADLFSEHHASAAAGGVQGARPRRPQQGTTAAQSCENRVPLGCETEEGLKVLLSLTFNRKEPSTHTERVITSSPALSALAPCSLG